MALKEWRTERPDEGNPEKVKEEEKLVTGLKKKGTGQREGSIERKRERERKGGGDGRDKRRRKVERVSSARDRSAKLSGSVTNAGGPVFNVGARVKSQGGGNRGALKESGIERKNERACRGGGGNEELESAQT